MPAIFQRMILIVIFLLIVCFSSHVDRSNRFTVETEKGYAEEIKQICLENNFSLLFKVTTEMFIIQYNGDSSGSEVLERISDQHQNELHLECKDYHGMNIEDVWNLNITGKGIVVAIADVGINVDLLELKNRVDNTLSFNFEDASSDVTPEMFPNMTCECLEKTDHANRMASVIVAEKGNYICNAGIAYNAKVAARKVFKVKCNPGESTGQQTDGEILAKAFLYKPYDIDIFVNAWRPKGNFDRLDRAPLEALKKGTETGRRGLGTVYLVPAGKAGNALSNNIYTITVGGIGQFGDVPPHSNIDVSVITSGFSQGNNINASYMVTASNGNKCIDSFTGTSLATAQVAGIIALGLEANPFLTWGDILHLLVAASQHTGLQETNAFKMNAAGHHVHEEFGFGWLNASRFVELARFKVKTPMLITNIKSLDEHRQLNDGVNDVSFCFDCDTDDTCVTRIEYVSLTVQMEKGNTNLSISIISPGDTESVLMANSFVEHKDNNSSPYIECAFVSSHFWDEPPFGNWTVRVALRNKMGTNLTTILVKKLKIDGTGMLLEKTSFCKTKDNVTTERNTDVELNISESDQSLNISIETIHTVTEQYDKNNISESYKVTNLSSDSENEHRNKTQDGKVYEIKVITLRIWVIVIIVVCVLASFSALAFYVLVKNSSICNEIGNDEIPMHDTTHTQTPLLESFDRR